MKYHYMVVEGPHDAAAVGKLLEIIGARAVKKLRTLERLDEKRYFMHLARLDFPYKDDLTERMPVPLFFRFEDSEESQLIAIHATGGESALVSTMAATLNNLDDNGRGLTSLAIMGDADGRTPEETLAYYKEKLKDVPSVPAVMAGLSQVSNPGFVLERLLRIGIFVLPDNEQTGTLETVLLECATESFNDLRIKAEEYVHHFLLSYGANWSDSQKAKAMVGCMNNIFRPGTSNTVSIAKDEWFCTATLMLSSPMKLLYFMKQLLGLEACSPESEAQLNV